MALDKIEWTGDQCGWGIWHITESENILAEMALPEECPTDILSLSKRLEWIAGRILIRKLAEESGLHFKGIGKDSFGKPFLINLPHSISLSHSYPYVAAQIDSHTAVGIDVEQPKEKLLKVAHRVLSRSEEQDAGNDITKNCVYWCAKEALYKIYGKKGLSFSNHLNIEPFRLGQYGSLVGRILANGSRQTINLVYAVAKEFVLVHTKTN
jgi:4'-phosphopantetheinyl transferase